VYELSVPRLNSNDGSYVLTEWFYADGDLVPGGAEVALIETSKATQGIACEEGGILLRVAKEAHECRPGEVIARLFRDETERAAVRPQTPAREAEAEAKSDAADLVITEPARRLIEQHGLDLSALSHLGRRMIGRADVQRLLDGQRGAEVTRYTPSREQRAVAETVSKAHRTIPAAHATVRVTVEGALKALREYGLREGITVRLPELVVRALAETFPRYPLFFATTHDDGEVSLAIEPRVGVTVDVGRGLTIPVVGAVDLASLRRIAEALTRFRVTALRGRFAETDLHGGNIAVSLPAGDVIFAQPLIPPGHACTLSLGAIQVGATFTTDSRVTLEQFVYLGLAYDHRLINGRDAAMFLGDVKQLIENPQRLSGLMD
jgi:2-oxoglutarate dehydrogenase E2 component (dihydrolipoamide succinyltransferase)